MSTAVLDPPTLAEPVLFPASAAHSCPVKTQNAFDPTLRRPAGVPAAGVTAAFDERDRFVARVLEAVIAASGGRAADLRLLATDPAEQIQATRRAMTARVEVILGGQLPADPDGHRRGTPDLLVRGGDTADGAPGYHPVLVRWHKLLAPVGAGRPEDEPSAAPGRIRMATLQDPSAEASQAADGVRLRPGRSADLLQLAHFRRILEAAGVAAPEAVGALVGTDDGSDEPRLVWLDLNEPVVRTFSRTSPAGWRLLSALASYDHELAWRVDIAEAARRRTGDPGDPPPLVAPVATRECARCPWWEHCDTQLHPDDVSRRIDRGQLDRREVEVLRRLGHGTASALAACDLDRLLPDYLPDVTHRAGAEARLRTAVRRARMLGAGVDFDRETVGPISLPRARVEIDLDVESSADGRVYLWGFLLDDGAQPGGPRYVEFSRFSDLDDETEYDLAREAFDWLRGLQADTDDLRVYHYSEYEVSRITALAARGAGTSVQWAAEMTGDVFVDLLETVKSHYFGVHGLGLKLVARHAGFGWRDQDPGGLNSQLWFAEAVHGEGADRRAAARRRVLEYNEDDVAATHHVRAWLRAQR